MQYLGSLFFSPEYSKFTEIKIEYSKINALYLRNHNEFTFSNFSRDNDIGIFGPVLSNIDFTFKKIYIV